MIIKVLGAFLAVVTLAVIMRIPKKFIVYSGMTGAAGWFIYLFTEAKGWGDVFCNFLAALVVALISHSFARTFKAPVTVFLITGMIPLVPGTGMYRTVYNLITSRMSLANFYFAQTLQIAGVIALAIFIMDSIFRIFQK